jgi:hypothetical protein
MLLVSLQSRLRSTSHRTAGSFQKKRRHCVEHWIAAFRTCTVIESLRCLHLQCDSVNHPLSLVLKTQ